MHRGLAERGVPHLRFSADDLDGTLSLIKTIEPDVIFRQSQWDADVPEEFGTARLGFARTCLVPYETMNIVVNVADAVTANSAVDTDYHRAAWLVFCTNEMMREIAVRDGMRDGAQFRVVGHPKADHLRSATPRWPTPPAAGDAVRPGRIVWSAHHTIGHGWTDYGAFHLMRDDMLAWARQRDDVQFVFMPHPALLPFPDSDGLTDQPRRVRRVDERVGGTAPLRRAVGDRLRPDARRLGPDGDRRAVDAGRVPAPDQTGDLLRAPGPPAVQRHRRAGRPRGAHGAHRRRRPEVGRRLSSTASRTRSATDSATTCGRCSGSAAASSGSSPRSARRSHGSEARRTSIRRPDPPRLRPLTGPCHASTLSRYISKMLVHC